MHCWPLPDHYIVVILLLRTYALWGLSRYVLWYIAVFDIVSDNQGVVVGLLTFIPVAGMCYSCGDQAPFVDECQ